MARCLGFRGYDAHALANELIHQRALAHVGVPHNVNESGLMAFATFGRRLTKATYGIGCGCKQRFSVLTLNLVRDTGIFIFCHSFRIVIFRIDKHLINAPESSRVYKRPLPGV